MFTFPVAFFSVGEDESEFSVSYLFGGYKSSNVVDTDMYDPDTWTTKTDMPSPSRRANNSFSLNYNAYVVGGYSTTALADNDEYTFSSDTWASKTDCTVSVFRNVCFSAASKGYTVTGSDSSGADLSQNTYAYTQNVDSWSLRVSPPSRNLSAGTSVLDKGYVFGGNSGGYLSQSLRFTPTDTWEAMTNLPGTARQSLSACNVADKIYVTGGNDNSDVQDCCEFDVSDTWTTKTSMPSPARCNHTSASIDGKLYVFGGENKNDVDEFNVSGNSWTSMANMATARWSSTAQSN